LNDTFFRSAPVSAARLGRLALWLCLGLLGLCLLPVSAGAIDRSLAKTPPMGWNSWYAYRCQVTEAGVLANAKALVDSGMAARGYRFVNVDGCWEGPTRTGSGKLRSDPVTFPSGMAALGRAIHSQGLKFGIYTSAGPTICLHPQPGSYGHYAQDFRTFASWKVDYVKVDWCSQPPGGDYVRSYRAIARAAARSGRRMIVAVSTPGTRRPWRWAPPFGQLWRIGHDADGSWSGIMAALDRDAPLWPYAGPGRWNDPDILQVGSQGLTATEERAHFSLWSMLAAPLLAGYDLTSVSGTTLATLMNEEVIAVNQDRLGFQGRRVRTADGMETWVRPLVGGSWAVLFLNRAESPQRLLVSPRQIPGLPRAKRYSLRDLWARTTEEAGADDVRTLDLAAHEAVMWRVDALRSG
jgi:alpha-galactosidase